MESEKESSSHVNSGQRNIKCLFAHLIIITTKKKNCWQQKMQNVQHLWSDLTKCGKLTDAGMCVEDFRKIYATIKNISLGLQWQPITIHLQIGLFIIVSLFHR